MQKKFKLFSYFGFLIQKVVFIVKPRMKIGNKSISKIKLVYFAGNVSISYLNASLISVYKSWDSIPEILIISDGTEEKVFRNKLIRWPVEVTVLDWSVCANYYKSIGNNDLYNYATNELWGRKLVGIFYCFKLWRTLYSDTDVIWFRDPIKSLPEYSLSHNSIFIKMSSDIEPCYSMEMVSKFGNSKTINYPMNAGIIYGFGDFSTIAYWVDLCRYLNVNSDNRTEQTAFAIITSSFGATWSMDEIYIGLNDFSMFSKNKELYKKIFARHYVNYKNWLFWRDFISKIYFKY